MRRRTQCTFHEHYFTRCVYTSVEKDLYWGRKGGLNPGRHSISISQQSLQIIEAFVNTNCNFFFLDSLFCSAILRLTIVLWLSSLLFVVSRLSPFRSFVHEFLWFISSKDVDSFGSRGGGNIPREGPTPLWPPLPFVFPFPLTLH